jgi:hypothetical protein
VNFVNKRFEEHVAEAEIVDLMIADTWDDLSGFGAVARHPK